MGLLVIQNLQAKEGPGVKVQGDPGSSVPVGATPSHTPRRPHWVPLRTDLGGGCCME